MTLKKIFNTMKKEGYVIKNLDKYLLSLNDESNDRVINVNAPSQAGNCLRANYYARLQYEKDTNSIDPRTRRIFDNGSGVHERIQNYLTKAGILVMEEVPLRNDEYNIQGHTDGLVKLNARDLGILEIKSMNSNSFSQLKDAKPEHKIQAMVYVFCAESRRQELQTKYKNEVEFKKSLPKRMSYYGSLYTHIKGGKRYTREQKISKKVAEHEQADDILFRLSRPIDTVIFIYEDKNDQNIKEFAVKIDEFLLKQILKDYEYLNECVESKTIPDRAGTSKSVAPCRFCNYKLECFN